MNSGTRHFFALSFILLAPFSSAEAQNAMVLGKLTEWNNAAPPPQDQLIKTAVQKTTEGLYLETASCGGSDIEISKVEPATGDLFVMKGRIAGTLRNAWFVTVQMPKCDSAPVRFMLIQQADSGLKTIRMNRGTSYAWESLIADTFLLARLGADGALKRKSLNCGPDEKPILGITRVASEEPNLGPVYFGIRYKGSWT
jgi:hypothetical protein